MGSGRWEGAYQAHDEGAEFFSSECHFWDTLLRNRFPSFLDFSQNPKKRRSRSLRGSSRFTARRRPWAGPFRWRRSVSGAGDFEGGLWCQPYRKLHGGQNAVLIALVRPLLPIQRCVGVSKSPSATTYFASTTVLHALTSHPASPHHPGRRLCEFLDDSSTPDIVRKILHEHWASRKVLTGRFPADYGTSFSCC